MQKHVTIVAVLKIGFGVLGLIIGLTLFVLLAGIGVATQEIKAISILTIVGTVLGAFFIILAIPGIIGGIGLLNHKPWARILILILSVIDLINIPIGTAVGIYSIWVLVQDETIKLFSEEQVNPTQ
ncbi:MAG: hypothetical protein A2V66_18455 [Ignavibacteria bacterium RBG_13_36_8]|nr:MAG: hypothetical protein A2V66_18455 [Ignavibacteria bacterium RBG_13_36_8]